MILEPLKQFLIEFKLNNPSDTTSYFPQAVVNDSVNGTTLATLNLTDNGNQYFSKLYTLPADNSGTGLQITITTTVYTDAAHTNISTIYGAQIEQFIVRHLASQLLGGWERSGVKPVDYNAIEKLVRKVVAEISIPKSQRIDLAPLTAGIEELAEAQRMAESNYDIRSTQGEDYMKQTIADHYGKTSKLVSDGISKLRDELTEILQLSEDRGGERHAVLEQAVGKLQTLVDGIAGDTSLHDRMSALEGDVKESHAKILNSVRRPIRLKRMVDDDPDDDEEKDKQEGMSPERRMTIEKLLNL